MKYWLYFAGKLVATLGTVFALHLLVTHLFPAAPKARSERAAYDTAYLLAVLGVFLIGAGLLVVVIWDQRRRCRSCLRVLIMPLATGSWGNMLTSGRPRTEWICRFGHGTLSIEELQITGKQLPAWQPHDENIWRELESYCPARK